MSKVPIISVIMPLYNKRPYVKRSIESVQQQTFSDWELIIIDDGSTDGSIAEIPRGENRVKLIQQDNAGPATARNNGIKIARGEFITFLDADDVYYSHKLETEMIFLKKEKLAKWMISAFDHEQTNATTIKRFCDVKGDELGSQVTLIENAISELSMKGIHIDGLCIDKHLLLNLGGFNKNMKCFEITELMIRCALEQPRVLVYSNQLYRVFDVPGSAFKESSNRINGMRQMGESLYNLSISYPEYSDTLTRKSRKSIFSYITNLIRLNRKIEAREYLIHNFPYSRNIKWFKLWMLSWFPTVLLQMKLKDKPKYTGMPPRKS